MKKLSIKNLQSDMTFADGCNMYLDNCRQRNLREGTINHYRSSYTQFFKFFPRSMPLSKITSQSYNDYVVYLTETLDNDISINSYLRDLITTLHFLMKEGYVREFKMQSIKTDRSHVETYTEHELQILLKKPNLKKCSFVEYQSWTMTNFLFCTGIRQRSLMNIKIKDVDFDNRVVNVNVTKNRKPLIIPVNQTMSHILKEWLKYRQYKTKDDYLFCNVYGQQLMKSTCYHMLYSYNKNRGVETTGIHRFRHTFAKQWILNGGDVVTLSRILGHSNLTITQNYINLLVSDIATKVDEINLLDKFSDKQRLTLK